MKQVNIHEAKTRFSQLVAEVEAGEEIIVARNGKPVATLKRADSRDAAGRSNGRRFGSHAGRISHYQEQDFLDWKDEVAAAMLDMTLQDYIDDSARLWREHLASSKP